MSDIPKTSPTSLVLTVDQDSIGSSELSRKPIPTPRFVLSVFVATVLTACGGGGGGSSTPVVDPPSPPDPVTPPASANCSVSVTTDSSTRSWPIQGWETATPASQGLCPDDLNTASDYAFEDGNTTGAMLVIKNGYRCSRSTLMVRLRMT